VKRHHIKHLGFEANSLVYARYRALHISIEPCRLVPRDNIVELLRMNKDSQEIASIRAALTCNERVFGSVKRAIARYRTEKDLVDYAEAAMKRFGADNAAFDTIVAAGKKSAIPHARSDTSRLTKPSIILVDMGVSLNGYCSDLTRTFFYGRISRFYRETYGKVLKAQEIAISLIKPGVVVSEVDQKVRSFFKKHSCDSFFTHALGHGLGRDVHEIPSLSYANQIEFEQGMVLTVEPGLYYPGQGGVRIEDMVLVTRTGCECLSRFPKKIEDMQIK